MFNLSEISANYKINMRDVFKSENEKSIDPLKRSISKLEENFSEKETKMERIQKESQIRVISKH